MANHDEETRKCWRNTISKKERKIVCTRVKMYINPKWEMVELASHVRVQKKMKNKKKKEKSTHCRSGLGSVNFLVRKYG